MIDLLCAGKEVTVNFALGPANVFIISSHNVADCDVIYHVEDCLTGHQDFVGSKWVCT